MIKPKQIIQRIDARLSRHGDLGAKLVKGVVGIAGIRLIHAAVGFVTTMILARTLAPQGYGIYAFVMAMVAFLTIPTELGIPGLAVREVAYTNARKDWSHMRGFIVRAHQAIGLLSILLILAGLTVLAIVGRNLDPMKRLCIGLGFLLIPLVSLGALRGAMLRGLRKVVLGQLPEEIFRPLTFMTMIIFLTLAARNLVSPASVLALQIVATTVAYCGGLYLFFKNRPTELASTEPSYKTSMWLKSSVPFGMMAALHLINGRTDILMLGFFRSDGEIGIYRVAVQMAALVVFGLRVVNAIQGPHIAHMYAQGDMKKLQKMITRSSQAILTATLPAVLLIVLFGESIIRIVFGKEYVGAYVPLVILCGGQLVNASMGSVASLLNMTGHERDTTKSIFIGAVVNIVLNVTLTPVWGMIGAAAATAATLIVWNVLMWRKVRLRIGIQTSPFFRRGK